MKTILSLAFIAIFSSVVMAGNLTSDSKKTLYDFKLNGLDGKPVDFAKYKGKKVLLVNVASKCGYTGQYTDLQKLHEKFGSKLVVVGVPANNFGSQEPGTASEIGEFCKKNYGVTFQMMEKISVKGSDQHPLYQWLSKKALNGSIEHEPTWNFCKYLIDEKGNVIQFFASKVEPLSSEITDFLK